MRVAIVAESFLPQVNGVVNSVLRVVEHLEDAGHDAVVIAPDSERDGLRAPRLVGRHTPVHTVPSMRFPGVTSLPVGVPMPSMYRALRDVRPDVVHLASPFVVGGAGALAAKRLGVPTVAVFQTDVAGFAEAYRLQVAGRAAWRYTRMVHLACDRTLAPSTATMEALAARGIPRLHRWARGVDTAQFSPARRDDDLRAQWGADRLIVGFVGRLAPEKHVERLAPLDRDPSVRLVIVGDGPERARLQRLCPNAVFTGELRGEQLARAYASLDVFAHPGEHETFCQAIQEAMASGIPVIGPDAGGPRDLVTPLSTGFLLDPATYADRIAETVAALREPARRAAMGRAGLAAVRARTWPALCEELLGHYGEVIAERGGDARIAMGRQRLAG
ncbi:MAG TPA: alpha-mannosyltransferase [Gordonia polyisoprenivorans]|uniref:glycosyltransferase family 4 protein n=1 Tax=Gordonia polyisoprenivorans TaxID=84595 RepID=UPI000ECFBE1C|nr:glycosyltransferase family 1 protein [Gordonia polyisoprenivorans]QUD81658.1 glycosyltransferase family 1 protein [Gordonia polyisoprenivorans]HCS59731.1 alpha-mannosyltransferase [Gordonia polyisoprenivorans]